MTKYEFKKIFSPITIGLIIIMIPVLLFFGYFDEYDFTKEAISNNTMDGARSELKILPKLIKENGNKVDENLKNILIREKENRLKYLEEKFQKIPIEDRAGYKSAEEYLNTDKYEHEDHIPAIDNEISYDAPYSVYSELLNNYNNEMKSRKYIDENGTLEYPLEDEGAITLISTKEYVKLATDKEYNTILTDSIVNNTQQVSFSIIFTVGVLITIFIIPYLLMDNKNNTLESIYTMKIGRKFFNKKFKVTVLITLILWVLITLLHIYMMHDLFDFTLFLDSRMVSFFTFSIVNSKITYLGYTIILLLFSLVTLLFLNFIIYLIGTKIMKSTTAALTSIFTIFSIFYIVRLKSFNPLTNRIAVFPYYFKNMIIIFSALLLISIIIYFISYRKNLKRDIL